MNHTQVQHVSLHPEPLCQFPPLPIPLGCPRAAGWSFKLGGNFTFAQQRGLNRRWFGEIRFYLFLNKTKLFSL